MPRLGGVAAGEGDVAGPGVRPGEADVHAQGGVAEVAGEGGVGEPVPGGVDLPDEVLPAFVAQGVAVRIGRGGAGEEALRRVVELVAEEDGAGGRGGRGRVALRGLGGEGRAGDEGEALGQVPGEDDGHPAGGGDLCATDLQAVYPFLEGGPLGAQDVDAAPADVSRLGGGEAPEGEGVGPPGGVAVLALDGGAGLEPGQALGDDGVVAAVDLVDGSGRGNLVLALQGPVPLALVEEVEDAAQLHPSAGGRPLQEGPLGDLGELAVQHEAPGDGEAQGAPAPQLLELGPEAGLGVVHDGVAPAVRAGALGCRTSLR